MEPLLLKTINAPLEAIKIGKKLLYSKNIKANIHISENIQLFVINNKKKNLFYIYINIYMHKSYIKSSFRICLYVPCCRLSVIYFLCNKTV